MGSCRNSRFYSRSDMTWANNDVVMHAFPHGIKSARPSMLNDAALSLLPPNVDGGILEVTVDAADELFSESTEQSIGFMPHSMGLGVRLVDIEQTAGPGDYDFLDYLWNTNSGTFGNADRFFKIEQTPGPGQYEVPQFPDVGVIPGCTIFFDDTRFKDIPLTPGPGDYNVPQFPDVDLAPSGACFGQNGETRFKDIPETPGPGTYVIPEPDPSPCDAEFGKAKARIKGARFYKIKCTPGPGFYTARSQFGEFTAPSGGKVWQVASRYLDIVTKKVTESKKKRKVTKRRKKKRRRPKAALSSVRKFGQVRDRLFLDQ